MSPELDLLPDAVLMIAPDGTFVAGNARAAALFGDLEARAGRPFVEAFDVRDVQGRPGVSRYPSVGDDIEMTLRHHGGVDVAVSVSAAVTEDGSLVLCARPVSDRSGIAIVSTVSHELRSPLTSVKGYVSLMLNRWDRIEDGKKREMLAQVHHDADRVTRLVTELLDISRLETGRLVLRRRMTDLGELARSVVEKVAMAYPELQCDVDVEGLPEVYVDPDKLEQVLTNLVENAAKYGDPHGMQITGSVDGNDVSVSVSDRGPGIPGDDLPKVFTKFFRRDHGRPTGTGLGLWISRGIVEAHDGELSARSTVGEGSTFTFTVPADAFDRLHQ